MSIFGLDSNMYSIGYGVIQKSKLGPVHHLIYTNVLESKLSKGKLQLLSDGAVTVIF